LRRGLNAAASGLLIFAIAGVAAASSDAAAGPANTASAAPARVVRRWFDGYRQAAADLGYVPDPEKIAFAIPVYVADTDERAHREARPALEWLFRKGLKQTAQQHSPPGYMSPSSLRGVLMAGMKPLSQLSYDELLAGGQVVVGNPLAVARRLRELHAELGGFGQLIGLFAIGPSTHEQVRRSTDLFASEVMPVLRSLGAAGTAQETAG
jgi:alkanesulfonate monooxygenase SsuD/methylene tetrahydromethanopterin reductase-like flavin-dependent oxidoreductase (luciferase family)